MSIVDWLHKAEQHEATREAEPQGLEGRVIAALRTVYDPELPVNIYDLGLVYRLDVDEAAGERERLLREGFTGYLSKPIDVHTFGESVERYLGGRT